MYLTYKRLGETPLQSTERFRLENSIPITIPMTYAGRLDPMAEGIMIILTGEECKDKDKYTGLDKEYEVEILLGVQTDSYDVLGLIENVDQIGKKEIDIKKYIGKFNQKYPRYSSKIIAMREIPDEMPIKEVEIYSIEKIEERELIGTEIAKQAIEKINLVKGEFRQGKIIEKWQEFSQNFGNLKFRILKLKILCSSGTYMRSLAYRMGGLAYSIKRIKVGNMEI